MMPITPRSWPAIISASRAPDPRRGQGREDGDRVDVALVEHAQHDIDGDDRRQDQPQLVLQRGLEGVGRAQEHGGDAGRHARSPSRRLWMALTAAPSETPGAVSNDDVGRRELADVVDLQRRGALLDRGDGRERRRLPAAVGQIERPRARRATCSSRGSACRITRSWLDWVKMVEMIRWPNA